MARRLSDSAIRDFVDEINDLWREGKRDDARKLGKKLRKMMIEHGNDEPGDIYDFEHLTGFSWDM